MHAEDEACFVVHALHASTCSCTKSMRKHTPCTTFPSFRRFLKCISGGSCPGINYLPQINPLNGLPMGCGSGRSCAPGYQCLTSTAGQLMCCTDRGFVEITGQNVCRNGGLPYRNGVNSLPLECAANGFFACPTGYSCQLSTTSSMRICCQDFVRNLYCPVGFAPNMIQNSPQYCYPSVANSCSQPFNCLQSPNSQGYICCRAATNYVNPCPRGQVPLQENGALQYCNDLGTLCNPNGYSCQLSLNGQERVCCGVATDGGNTFPSQFNCPNGRQALFTGTVPFTCTTTANNCPAGYSCEVASNGQNICCRQGTDSGTGTVTVGPIDTGDNLQCPNSNQKEGFDGNSRRCTDNNQCSAGYVCAPATDGSATICCRLPQCPANPSGTGFPEVCTVGGTPCTNNRNCVTAAGPSIDTICC